MDSSTENLQEFIELHPPLPDVIKKKEDHENIIELIDDRTEDDMFADDPHGYEYKHDRLNIFRNEGLSDKTTVFEFDNHSTLLRNADQESVTYN